MMNKKDSADSGRPDEPRAKGKPPSCLKVSSLAGEIILQPEPNEPGYWAYRVMPDNTLLKMELTREEWLDLRQKKMAVRRAVMCRLNEHPLNQAALERLRSESLVVGDNAIHLLQLAQQGLENGHGEPASDNDPRDMVLADYGWSLRLQESALMYLEELLEPEDVLEMSLPKLADCICSCLQENSAPCDYLVQGIVDQVEALKTGTAVGSTIDKTAALPVNTETVKQPHLSIAVVYPEKENFIEVLIQHLFRDVKTVSFYDSVKAWEELSVSKPDLLIAYEGMPRLSGSDLAQRFLDGHAAFPIIVFSSWEHIRDWVGERRASGANVSFLPLPFTVEEFRHAVETALRTGLKTPRKASAKNEERMQ